MRPERLRSLAEDEVDGEVEAAAAKDAALMELLKDFMLSRLDGMERGGDPAVLLGLDDGG